MANDFANRKAPFQLIYSFFFKTLFIYFVVDKNGSKGVHIEHYL